MIREIEQRDAAAFLQLAKQIEMESPYMLFEEGERQTTVEAQEKMIHSIKQSTNTTIFVAEDDDELVGYMMIIGGTTRKIQHRAHLVIGVRQSYCGKGIGTRLFVEGESWAKEQGIVRLELTVVTENEQAVSLYKKRGFEMEGVKRKSLRVDGKWMDEYYMGKCL